MSDMDKEKYFYVLRNNHATFDIRLVGGSVIYSAKVKEIGQDFVEVSHSEGGGRFKKNLLTMIPFGQLFSVTRGSPSDD